MHFSPCTSLALALCFALSANSAPAGTSFGGVYNSDAAQAYFAQRFGSNFFATLAAHQRSNSRSRSLSQRPVAAPVPTFFTNQPVRVVQVQVPQQQRVQQTPIFREAVKPQQKMSVKEQKADDLAYYDDEYYYDDASNDVIVDNNV